MTQLASPDLDIARLLFDLKRCGELVNRFTGWLEADAIATCVTDGLVETFGCAFARIWLVEPDRTALRLVASSGLYTRLDGSFARVPMGAFKVGKIAQHCIPFLSNCLPDETWVKDREWALENRIQGFAGLPLMAGEQAIGVLAVFSHDPMVPEFLEVLQMLSLSVTGALAAALNHQATLHPPSIATLSEQLADLLGRQKLSLLGTEQPLPGAIAQLLLDMGQSLQQLPCHYGRLVYEPDAVFLEAMLAIPSDALPPVLETLASRAVKFGGQLYSQAGVDQSITQTRLQLPLLNAEDIPATGDVPQSNGESPLSEREVEVMAQLVAGCRDRDIAEQLYISERTVKFHVKNVLTKLQVKTRVQAVYLLTQAGWITAAAPCTNDDAEDNR
ncbi:MAG: LuxR C-terminal-related transcriptional regulator [Cyanobacteria bacterium J06632_22]